MKTAAVCLDKWKLPIFKRHLGQAGYVYEEVVGITDDTVTLRVRYEWLSHLTPVIQAANQEAADAKR